MARPTSQAVIRVIRSTAQANGTGTSDRDLLRRFAEENDQPAFAALVRRHSAMVLGVCRRAVPNLQDAEDACQATFLVLARKAKSQRWQPSVANWLFATARKVAHNARVAAQRRARREARAAVPERVEPVDRMTGRELLAVLDEELGKLAARYREPLVLCCLEGLARDEAAARLGIPAATLKTHLERGRKRLASALTKRGYALGAGLLAVAATSPAEASTLLWVERLATVVTTSPTVSVAALAHSVGLQEVVRKALVALLVLLGAGLLGLGARSVVPAAGPAQPERAMSAERGKAPVPTDLKPSESLLTLAGRVLDPSGKPVAGAALYVPGLKRPDPTMEKDIFVTRAGHTDAEGRFRVNVPLLSLGRSYLIAGAPGFGVDWIELGEGKPPAEITLRLVPDVPIHGRVVNTEGKPMSGVSVSAVAINVPANDKLDDYLAGWLRSFRDNLSSPKKRLYLPLDEITGHVTTDRDGRFTLHGAGAERVVHVTFDGGGVARSTPYVITRPGFDPKPYNDELLKKEHDDLRVLNRFLGLYGPTLAFVAEPSKTIEGVVRDAAAGKPLPGCTVASHTGFGESTVVLTDAAGKFRLDGLPKNGRGYSVSIMPPKGRGYLSRIVQVPDSQGYTPVKLDVEMSRGVIVRGRVVDRQSGKGVEAGIRFAPLPENKYFGTKPGFDNYRTDRTMTGTDKEGRFRLVTIPGRALVLAQVHSSEKFNGQYLCPFRKSPPDPEHKALFKYDMDDDRWTITTAGGLEFSEDAVKVIDIQEEGETTVDLFVDRGRTAQLAVQDAEGKPLAGAWVAGLTEHWPITYQLPEPTATVFALEPRKPRTLVFYHAGKQLGGTALVRGDEKEPVVARLGPLAKLVGRMRDADGNPLAGAEISVNGRTEITRELYRFANPSGKPVLTDKDGGFTLTGVVPGVPIYVQTRKDQTFYVGKPRIGQLQLKPGEVRDLGERTVEPSR
jgi:RNA polymerase sigma factor (sigma-70 family)